MGSKRSWRRRKAALSKGAAAPPPAHNPLPAGGSASSGPRIVTQTQDGVVRGAVEWTDAGRAIVHLMPDANVTTPLYTFALTSRRHFAPPEMRVAEDWLGVRNGVWTSEHEEQFADGFIMYLAEGIAPRPDLVDAFLRFKQWIGADHELVSSTNVELTPQARAMFDRFLGGGQTTIAPKRDLGRSRTSATSPTSSAPAAMIPDTDSLKAINDRILDDMLTLAANSRPSQKTFFGTLREPFAKLRALVTGETSISSPQVRPPRKAPRSAHTAGSARGLGLDGSASWRNLKDEELAELLLERCILYGRTQDISQIPELFALYKHAGTRFAAPKRMEICTALIELFEKHGGEGHLGLMPFLAAEQAPQIISTAAMGLALLFPLREGDPLTGPKFVLNSARNSPTTPREQGGMLSGILLLGDRRLLPLLENAWATLPDEGRLQLTQATSPFVNEATVEFWMRCLEKGCSESVEGSVIAALVKMPEMANPELVFDIERVFPSYANRENPVRVLCRTTFPDYLRKIRSRLARLEASESHPRLIPEIYDTWRG